MAVEAPHLNLNNNRQLGIDGHLNTYAVLIPPLSSSATETFLPSHSFPTRPPPLTLPLSRKRTRDSVHQFHSTPQNHRINFSFLGEDIWHQIQYQQLEIQNLIAQHWEKLGSDIEEQVIKPNTRRIIATVEEGIVKKIRAKEEEIDKLGKLNWELEEKVKSLCMENQFWRNLAQRNEATVAALRTNLEQVLSNVHHRAGVTDNDQSCCGSNTEENVAYDKGGGDKDKGGRWCRKCGKEEACVLLLPCRHLCICKGCGLCIHVCPLCKSSINASLHLNMSSS